jgi:hypothetical protein
MEAVRISETSFNFCRNIPAESHFQAEYLLKAVVTAKYRARSDTCNYFSACRARKPDHTRSLDLQKTKAGHMCLSSGSLVTAALATLFSDTERKEHELGAMTQMYTRCYQLQLLCQFLTLAIIRTNYTRQPR